jgi:hypothetical protein
VPPHRVRQTLLAPAGPANVAVRVPVGPANAAVQVPAGPANAAAPDNFPPRGHPVEGVATGGAALLQCSRRTRPAAAGQVQARAQAVDPFLRVIRRRSGEAGSTA